MTSTLHVRPAEVADAAAISLIHSSNVTSWKTWAADGSAQPARYTDLTPYQRWLNGGPWLDAETCAYHLERLLGGGGFAFVAEHNGRVLAEAELNLADEPPPYGRNLNLATLYVHRNHQGQGLGSALMQHALALAAAQQCATFTVAHGEAPDFYAGFGLRQAERWRRLQLTAQASKTRYHTEPLPDSDYTLMRGWALPIGRYQNAQHDWERTRPQAVPDFEEWRELRLDRYWITLDRASRTPGRLRAALIFEEAPQYPGVANTFLFTPTGVSPNLIIAARDLAARSGFSHLHCFVRSDLKLPNAQPTDYTQQLLMKHLTSPTSR